MRWQATLQAAPILISPTGSLDSLSDKRAEHVWQALLRGDYYLPAPGRVQVRGRVRTLRAACRRHLGGISAGARVFRRVSDEQFAALLRSGEVHLLAPLRIT